MDPVDLAVALAAVLAALTGAYIAVTLTRAAGRRWLAAHAERTRPREVGARRDAVQRLSDDVTELKERVGFAERRWARRERTALHPGS